MERDNVRHIHPSQLKPNPIKDFLNKPAHELTVGDTFLMQAGSTLIAVLVPTMIAGIGVIFSRRQPPQEKHGL